MPTTRNLQASILFSLPFIGYQPANISNGQPALDASNLVKQTICSPPFKWPWNRQYFEYNLDADALTQDFEIEIPTFNYLESAWLIDPTDGKIKEIEVKKTLAAESSVQRPQSIAAELQDSDDDYVTFRFNAIPDRAYTLGGYVQKAAPAMTSPASSWAPIPDALSYIYDWGFLAMLSMITKDARTAVFGQRFVSHLLGAQDGLTALQRNIFIGDWLTILTAPERAQMAVQQGTQARSAT
jgi:hypothetical protein